MNDKYKEIIQKLYNHKQYGTYQSSRKLKMALNNIGLDVKQKDVQQVMEDIPLYQAYKRPNKKYNSYVASKPREEFQIDIMYMTNNRKNNDDYILTCIDVGTKIADAEIIRNKTPSEVLKGFLLITERMGKPDQIYADSGSEWKGAFLKHVQDNDIKLITVLTHAPFVERFNQTLKNMIYKHLQQHGYNEWNDSLLKRMIKTYNHTYHSVIEMTPRQALKDWDKAQINIYKHAKVYRPKGKKHRVFKVGDKVRLLKKAGFKQRSFLPYYTLGTYTIERIEDEKYYITGIDKPYLKHQLRHATDTKDENEYTSSDEDNRHDNIHEQVTKTKKNNQFFRREDIDKNNILHTKRERKPVNRLNL